jgi:hypothetical protein
MKKLITTMAMLMSLTSLSFAATVDQCRGLKKVTLDDPYKASLQLYDLQVANNPDDKEFYKMGLEASHMQLLADCEQRLTSDGCPEPVLFCRGTIVIKDNCLPGFHMVGGVCKPDVPQCGPNQHLVGGTVCVDNTPTCLPGTHLVGNVCVNDVVTCPVGQHVENNTCVVDELPACPSGQMRVGADCIDNNPTAYCPPGMTGTPPNCQAMSCPEGWIGQFPNCTDPNSPICPPGKIGTPPNNCVDISESRCPSGWTGTFPACTPPSNLQCPYGMIKRDGVCVPTDHHNITCDSVRAELFGMAANGATHSQCLEWIKAHKYEIKCSCDSYAEIISLNQICK